MGSQRWNERHVDLGIAENVARPGDERQHRQEQAAGNEPDRLSQPLIDGTSHRLPRAVSPGEPPAHSPMGALVAAVVIGATIGAAPPWCLDHDPGGPLAVTPGRA